MKPLTTVLCAGMISAGLAACGSSPRMDMAQSDMASPAVSAASVSSGQLQAFAGAARSVSAIERDYASQTQTARPEERVLLDREANGKKAEAVNLAGLTVPEFNAIAQAVQQDPALMRQYSDMMNAGSAGGMRSGGTMGGSGSMGGMPR